MGKVLQKQVEVDGKDDTTFRQGHGSATSRAASTRISTDYIQKCCEKVKKMLVESAGSGDV